MVEYAILTVFLSIAIIGAVHGIGEGSRDKLCQLGKNPGQFNTDTQAFKADTDFQISARAGDLETDLNCNGIIEIDSPSNDLDAYHEWLDSNGIPFQDSRDTVRD